VSDALHDLYAGLILDHSRNPRNRRALAGADRRAVGDNPLCGDRVTVSLTLAPAAGDGAAPRVDDVAFEGVGCAVAVAAASMMTERARGRTRAEIAALYAAFEELVAGKVNVSAAPELGELAAFAGVARFPVRGKCARLPWRALLAALDEGSTLVSTE
jgi:nitrogen fixation NifU-like protein